MLSLEVHELTKTYNRRPVFSDLSFSHTKGVLGIAGANGSGKSTLMKCLASLLRPNKGAIRWMQGTEYLTADQVKPLISFAAPYINLYSELTAFENLEFIREVSGEQEAPGFIKEIMDLVQMNGYEDRLFKKLSTGQQQRIKLASALVRDSDILFLDEAGSNLDTKGHALVSSIVREQKQKGKLVILASNDPQEIELCDQVIQLVAS